MATPRLAIHAGIVRPNRARILVRGGEGVTTPSRLPAGHPEGYLEAFATLYTEAAETLGRFRDGAGPGRETMVPNVSDGLAGMRFIAAGVRSQEGGGVWINLRQTLVTSCGRPFR